MLQVGHVYRFLLQGRHAGISLTDLQACVHQRLGMKAYARREFEHVLRVEQQDVSRVHYQLGGHLAEHYRERQMKVQARGDRQVDGSQGGDPL